jgi:SAM-dependent methyltransferase
MNGTHIFKSTTNGDFCSLIKYFDPGKKQLLCYGRNATSHHWDNHWDVDETIRLEIVGVKDTYVSRVTKEYLLPEEGAILEGGCGKGLHVAALVHNGYKCIGIDFAENTVRMVNQKFPELDIRYGDVRKLPFDDAYFIGYWSIGVIEHFWDGFGVVVSEMSRVVRKEGYLFISFPYMSPLRKIKSRFGLYKSMKGDNPDGFYQYILNSDAVIDDVCKFGFELVSSRPWDGLKGTKDEITLVKPLFQFFYDYEGSSPMIHKLRRKIDNLLSPVAGHNILLVLRKCCP